MSTRAHAATALPVTDTAGAATPPPITTRWVPAQRTGAPPVRRHPAAVAPLTPVAPAGAGERGREPARVLPLEDETTRRVIAQTRAIGQAILEVLAGARPAAQLVRWMDPAVHEALVLRADLIRAATARAAAARASGAAPHPGRTGHPAAAPSDDRRPPLRQAAVRSVHACRVTARCYEMSLVVDEPVRSRAMALRLELRHLQWRVTALQLG
ncbi:hypothetical protein GCM10011512_13100 [Tersicoccus solisilvae]|uniref:DUF4439 domain-containing protein n=1 Tax=Tersicoccus solisilvae TaxID=1882339 RepID=A0ABQ1P2B4_9MICC|nr:Rv3235 family protein [Tersicoccus solisilvae]GGC87535.1 hypothetical protein GCM10011512_13100 [Tersicoccus solisilvae]